MGVVERNLERRGGAAAVHATERRDMERDDPTAPQTRKLTDARPRTIISALQANRIHMLLSFYQPTGPRRE